MNRRRCSFRGCTRPPVRRIKPKYDVAWLGCVDHWQAMYDAAWLGQPVDSGQVAVTVVAS